jgi:hypothetical protein
VEDWPLRRAQYLQRLGQWVALTMQRLDLSSRQLEALAIRTGEPTSSNMLLRMARLRLSRKAPDLASERVSLTPVLWLATLAGQTLTDVDRYLRSGDVADLEASPDSRADTMRGVYLALSPARQQALEEFAHHLYQLDEVARGSHAAPTSPTAELLATLPDVFPSVGETDPRAEVLAVRSQLEVMLAQLQALEARAQGEQDTDEDEGDDEGRQHKRPRRA